MKALLLCLALTGCTSAPTVVQDKALINLCAMQVVKIYSESSFIVREHCEPEGDKS